MSDEPNDDSFSSISISCKVIYLIRPRLISHSMTCTISLSELYIIISFTHNYDFETLPELKVSRSSGFELEIRKLDSFDFTSPSQLSYQSQTIDQYPQCQRRFHQQRQRRHQPSPKPTPGRESPERDGERTTRLEIRPARAVTVQVTTSLSSLFRRPSRRFQLKRQLPVGPSYGFVEQRKVSS